MTTMNHIEGVLTLTAPLHCSSHTDESTTRTMKQPIVGPNGTTYVPYFPANDLRGRLRRKAAQLLIDHLTASSRISVELLAGLTCGAITGSGENDVSVEEVLRARANVYMGVFGGGTRLMRSGMQIHDLLPFVNETVAAGMVPNERLGIELPVDAYGGGKDASGKWIPALLSAQKLVHMFQTTHVNDTYRVTNMTLLEQALEDPSTEVAAHQAAVLAERALRKSGGGKKVVDLDNIMGTEGIAVGTQMYLRIDLDDHLTDAQRGLVLLALRDLCNEQALGGMVRHAFGRFKADVRGKFDGNNVDDNGTALPVISLNNETGMYQLFGIAETYAANAMAEIGKLTIADMWAFFQPMMVVDENGKKKKRAV